MPKDYVIRTGVIFAIIVLTVLFCAKAQSQQVLSFGWDPSPDTNVIGYLVEYGTSSGSYTSQIDVGNIPSVTVSNLINGDDYYLVVVAYDALGNQSPPSGELEVTIPGRLYLTPPANPGDPVAITFPVAPGHWYEVQSATTLGDWHTIWQTKFAQDYFTAEYDDPASTTATQCFYRLILH